MLYYAQKTAKCNKFWLHRERCYFYCIQNYKKNCDIQHIFAITIAKKLAITSPANCQLPFSLMNLR